MADQRTDAEANEQDNDGLQLFTASTPTPRSPAGNPISQADEALFRALVPYAYRDLRGNWWVVKWGGSSWNAFPTAETARVYNAQYGTQMDGKRMFAASSDAQGMIEAIDERIESARTNAQSGGDGWLLLVLLALVAIDSKGGRRR